jgi:cell division protein FtsB
MAKTEKSSPLAPRHLLIAGVSFLFFVLLISAFFGKKGWLEIHRTRRQKVELQTRVTRLTEKRDTLLRDIQELRSNPRAVDYRAREQLWLMAPDEIVILK